MNYSAGQSWLGIWRSKGYSHGILVTNRAQNAAVVHHQKHYVPAAYHPWDEDYHIWLFPKKEYRDEFVKSLPSGAWVDDPGPEGRLEAARERISKMLQVTLMGANFRPAEAKEIIKELSIGDVLHLEADPNNEYDSTAVAVYSDDGKHHLGFIPRESNSALFAALMDGASISAEVVAFESTLKPVLEIELPE